MFGRTGARVALLLLALFASATLLPLAAADHAYSHRYVVFGQVVDAAGNPVPDVFVNLDVKGPDINFLRDRCVDQPGIETEALGKTQIRPVTDENGMFIYCFHIHALPRVDTGKLTFDAENGTVTKTIDMDAFMRVSYVTLELPDTRANANTTDDSYLVMGRLWRPTQRPVTIEHITVYGETIIYEDVNITLKMADGSMTRATGRTNGYGDFAVRVPTETPIVNPTIIVETSVGTVERGADTTSSDMGAFKLQFAEKKDPAVTTALWGLGIVVGLAVIGGGGWYAWRKFQDARSEKEIRDRSTRKRANR